MNSFLFNFPSKCRSSTYILTLGNIGYSYSLLTHFFSSSRRNKGDTTLLLQEKLNWIPHKVIPTFQPLSCSTQWLTSSKYSGYVIHFFIPLNTINTFIIVTNLHFHGLDIQTTFCLLAVSFWLPASVMIVSYYCVYICWSVCVCWTCWHGIGQREEGNPFWTTDDCNFSLDRSSISNMDRSLVLLVICDI